jgi:hypothetical protein
VQRKPAIKKTVDGKVFALDYGRLMGDPIIVSLVAVKNYCGMVMNPSFAMPARLTAAMT